MTDRPGRPATITVIAGTNGAGKSSILGHYLRERGGEYFNADEIALSLREQDPSLTQTDANSLAWTAGRDLLVAAIEQGLDYTFETTLGGRTMPRLLTEAASRGHRVVIWYVGLDSPEAHIGRVRARVERGGHPIPEETIRARFTRSLENLIGLLPVVAEFRLFDNSYTADLDREIPPRPVGLLHVRDGEMLESVDLPEVPAWARPVFAAFLTDEG